jgi:RNA polymerase sigma-70 factor (ECF subfamily)
MDSGSDTFEVVNTPSPDPERIDIDAAYQQHAELLHGFLCGVLRNDALVADAIQATFLKLLEQGDKLRDLASLKSWLFQVAFNEAMLVKRKKKTARDHSQQVAWRSEAIRTGHEAPDLEVLKKEQSEQVRIAIESLPAPQQVVVRKRIYEGLKFREIAEELDVPLGTILARMQSAIRKLKPFFEFET